ncbi:hypothetical protein GYMLUDRAFT_549848 [Collybiopsis luxurians FD-317 M1]|nr:hypothetical protein GYMLUDRAFT_549848 [Collybiopsis luxurians FD-317 M1]
MSFFSVPAQEILTSRFASLAASTIIVYDHLLTLDKELELIWQSSWSLAKVLFFFQLESLLFVNFGRVSIFAFRNQDTYVSALMTFHQQCQQLL